MGGIFLIISSISHSSGINLNQQYSWDSNLSWIGLANWLPFFLCFHSFEIYLSSAQERKTASLTFLYGTFPVIISGLGQAFFNWHGPLKTLGGLIIWYQRPIDSVSGLTGLFNHANYAGSWLTFLLPLSIALALKTSRKSIFFKTNLILIIFCILLTNSRNAWACRCWDYPNLYPSRGREVIG